MKRHSAILSLVLLSAAAAVPAMANEPVQSYDLHHFVGSNLFGDANANLGVVSAVSTRRGEVALVGRHGEVATIDVSMLERDGSQLYAPDLSVGDIAAHSGFGESDIPITHPRVRVIE